jgi:hypothetical protein
MNFKHLHYFWVTAKAGGVMRAGEQLHTTPQTLSAQIKLLEDRLGRKLFRKAGRGLELTDDGRVALTYADESSKRPCAPTAWVEKKFSNSGSAWPIRWPSRWPAGCSSRH